MSDIIRVGVIGAGLMVKRMTAAGLLGRKPGRGLYDYQEGR
jgi:hypothetical protein